ncbi:MAG: hypothetical protein AAF677_13915 [Pseudomonadota bacterium]
MDGVDEARVRALFTRSDGRYRFARWGRAVAPAIFGLDGESARVMGEALRATASLAGLDTVDEDPELGANAFVFACGAWGDLREVPGLDRLIPDLARLTQVLSAAGANQYRIFGFDGAEGAAPGPGARPGAIRIAITLLRLDDAFARYPWRVTAAGQAVQSMLLWSDHAFTAESPVAEIQGVGRALAKPWVQALIRAAYDPALPAATDDPAHATALASAARDAG